mgnify:CR=1 FL=1
MSHTRPLENALDDATSVRSRPASVAGQFVATELAAQGQTLRKAQDALLQFQLEHNVSDLPREINAVQDTLRTLRSARDNAQVQASLAEARSQLQRYRTALHASYGETLRLRTYAVVGLGFERLVWEEVSTAVPIVAQ